MQDWGAVAYIVRVEPVFRALKSRYCTDESCKHWDISSSPFPVSEIILFHDQNVKVHVPNMVSHAHPFDKKNKLDTSIHTGDTVGHWMALHRSHRFTYNYIHNYCSSFGALDTLSRNIAYQLW